MKNKAETSTSEVIVRHLNHSATSPILLGYAIADSNPWKKEQNPNLENTSKINNGN